VIFFKIIISILLLIGIVSPKIAWKITEGWKYKNAEPSTFYLIMGRIVSIFMLMVIWFAIPN
jgi:hypothetical protein